MSNVNMEATTILPVLKKKLAFLSGKTHTHTRCEITVRTASCSLASVQMSLLFYGLSSGGKDRRSGLILTIPLNSDQTSMEELSATLDYLLSIPRYTHTHIQCLQQSWESGGCLVMLLNGCFDSFLKPFDMLGVNVSLRSCWSCALCLGCRQHVQL